MVYERIVEYCKAQGISIHEFEKRCGIGNGTVRMWHKGSAPSLTTLRKISDTTGMKLAYILEGQHE